MWRDLIYGDEMYFDEYSTKFKKLAEKMNYSVELIECQLQYAEKLIKQNLPIIYDANHLSVLVGVKLEYLYGVSNSPKDYYRYLTKRKKRCGVRVLNAPLPLLKEVQVWIANSILSKLDSSVYAKAYKKNNSIKSNAKFHRKQKIVITMDISDYFGNTTVESVIKLFLDLGYYKSIAILLAKLCCLDDRLPQGAPTSPVLSNLVNRRLDKRLAALSSKYNARYTRYSDDIIFSGNDIKPEIIIPVTGKILESEGYSLNPRKVKVRRDYQKQIVTGIVVNNKMRIDKKELQSIRQEVYYIEKFGLDSHFQRYQEQNKHKSKESYLHSLLGRISHALFVNPKDTEMKRYKDLILEINRNLTNRTH